MPHPLRILALAAFATTSATAVLLACSDDETPLASGDDASADARRDRAAPGEEEEDASEDAGDGGVKDAGKDAKVPRDANGPGEAGDLCVFNHDCNLALRCACNEECVCEPGARGTGKAGVDGCDSGNQCASAVCLEGIRSLDGASYCTDACESSDECPAKLPLCTEIVFVGVICSTP